MVFHQFFKKGTQLGRDTQGMALFMVLACIGVLAILVTDFVYITQVGQAIAYGGLDQTQAHYLAKTGLKISLMRLKAFQKARAIPNLPKRPVQEIWKFPLELPLPKNLPGVGPLQKDAIDKFQKELGLEGKVTATIEAESSKYNLNWLSPQFRLTKPPEPGKPPTETDSNGEIARKALAETLQQILNRKMERDPEFAAQYRDFRVLDFVDGLAAWVDRKYQRKMQPGRDAVPMKRAPIYSIEELHNLPMMDDDLYQLFAPHFTVGYLANQINLNTIQEDVLRTLVPRVTKEEVQEFFKFRDSMQADNFFKTEDDFFKYVSTNFNFYRGSPKAMEDLRNEFKKNNIEFTTDSDFFLITVQAKVNAATRTIRAWVKLSNETPPPPPLGGITGPPDSGLAITFMRID